LSRSDSLLTIFFFRKKIEKIKRLKKMKFFLPKAGINKTKKTKTKKEIAVGNSNITLIT
jgi:hypothetical protein